MITERDNQVIEFIKHNPCRSDVIQRLFYPSVRVANRRLEIMTDYKYVSRYRSNVNEKYFYYVGKRPKQLDHMDLCARTILWMQSQGYVVLNFRREVKLDGIRPDAIVAVEKDGKTGIVMIEIERFNNSLLKKISLYEKVYRDQKYFSTFKILYVCNKKVSSDLVHVINIRPKEIEEV